MLHYTVQLPSVQLCKHKTQTQTHIHTKVTVLHPAHVWPKPTVSWRYFCLQRFVDLVKQQSKCCETVVLHQI